MSKSGNKIGRLSGEEQAALGQFQRDFQTVAPHMVEMGQTAKRLHQAMIDAPFWTVAETPKPDDAEEPKVWTVGHAQVNYVDHIKTEGAQP